MKSGSWNLPSADELEFELRLTHGVVKRALPHARRRRGAKRVEQFENPPLAGVVAHLCDALQFSSGLYGAPAVAVRGQAPFADDCAPRRNLCTQGRARCLELRGRLRPACPRRRLLWLAAIEERDRHVNGHDTADIPIAEVGGLRAANDLRLRDHLAPGRAFCERCGINLV